MSDQLKSQIPPSAPEAEQGIIGAILQSSIAGAPRNSAQLLDELRGILQPDDFATAHGEVYRKALQLHQEGRPVDKATLTTAMRGEWAASEDFWENLIWQAMLDVPHDGHVIYHAGMVTNAANQRRLLYAVKQATAELYEGAFETADIVAKLEAEIDAQAERRTNGKAVRVDAVVLDVIAELEAEVPAGIKTGICKLDAATGGGLKPGQMVTIAARPGVGKTALMLAIAEYIACHGGQALIISQEMSRGELIQRLLAAACGVAVDDLRGFIRDDRKRAVFLSEAERIAKLQLLIDDQPGRKISDVESLARIHKRQGGLSIICLDYLQLFKPENRKATTEEQVAQISREIKMLAKSIGCPVLVLAQLNRNIENREDRRPRLADLRSSGAIEQDSDIVGFLDRPHMYSKGVPASEAVLVLAKNRNGETQDIPLQWHGRTMRFSNPQLEPWVNSTMLDPWDNER
ncbi:MAG: DnaB-like helicase C-terminal domain-containing protein [Planctomycetota bacterium]